MTEDDFYSALIAWVKEVTSLTLVIRAYENGPRPSGVYASVNLLSSENLGIDTTCYEVADPDNNVDVAETVVGRRIFMVSINVFRSDDGVGLCEKLKASLRGDRIHRDFFSENGIGFVRASGVRRLPELVQNKYENRAEFDAWFNVALTYTDVLESVEESTVNASLRRVDTEVHEFTQTMSGG